MTKKIIAATVCMLYSFTIFAQTGVANKTSYNIKDFGAAGDGIQSDTKAINNTIDSAAAAGGGTVFFPAGNYLTGTIHLKNNISLFLDQGSVVIAAPVSAANGYDEEEQSVNTVYQDAGHSHWNNSLIVGVNLHDISITGQGTIWGKGLYKDFVKGAKQNANKAISLLLCRNVTISDISILHGGWFAILATGVDNCTIHNVKIDTNRDGMDIDCCRGVHVSDCSVNSPYDDGICLKSTYGLGLARATENVTITNCIVSGFDEGSLLNGTFTRTTNEQYKTNPTGRIKFGTESNGGFKNITVSNCVFNYCRGFALETVDGGLLEDVTITNITMRDIVNAPIFLRLASRMRGPANVPVGQLRRIIISNIVAYNIDPAQGIFISGIPGNYIQDIQLKNIQLYFKGGGKKEMVSQTIAEQEKGYPEPGSFGTLPAYGVFIRHAKNILLDNININFIEEDKRAALLMNDVEDADIRFVKAVKVTDVPRMIIQNSSDINIFRSFDISEKMFSKVTEEKL